MTDFSHWPSFSQRIFDKIMGHDPATPRSMSLVTRELGITPENVYQDEDEDDRELDDDEYLCVLQDYENFSAIMQHREAHQLVDADDYFDNFDNRKGSMS
jgi:hypothetical protein